MVFSIRRGFLFVSAGGFSRISRVPIHFAWRFGFQLMLFFLHEEFVAIWTMILFPPCNTCVFFTLSLGLAFENLTIAAAHRRLSERFLFFGDYVEVFRSGQS